MTNRTILCLYIYFVIFVDQIDRAAKVICCPPVRQLGLLPCLVGITLGGLTYALHYVQAEA
jgi:hypothetical protein